MFFNYKLLLITLLGLPLLVNYPPDGLFPLNQQVRAQTTQTSAPNPIFQPILADLTAKTQIPIRLPPNIPASGKNPLYISLTKVTPTGYVIELAFAPDCYGAGACRFGEIAAEKKINQSPTLKGQKVALTKGITGYYTPATCGANCSDSSLVWEQGGIIYRMALKAGKLESLKSMANSAIASVPVATSKSISSQGIGSAQLGMSYGQLKAQLGKKAQFQVKTDFRVDFEAIAVLESGQIQYYILYPAGEKFQDRDVIKMLVTDNPNYRTSAGVGPGTSLLTAQKVYGQATLFYNRANESREYVKFAKQHAANIYFRSGTKAGELAGIYLNSSQEYQETTKFKPEAIINSVEVISRNKQS